MISSVKAFSCFLFEAFYREKLYFLCLLFAVGLTFSQNLVALTVFVSLVEWFILQVWVYTCNVRTQECSVICQKFEAI